MIKCNLVTLVGLREMWHPFPLVRNVPNQPQQGGAGLDVMTHQEESKSHHLDNRDGCRTTYNASDQHVFLQNQQNQLQPFVSMPTPPHVLLDVFCCFWSGCYVTCFVSLICMSIQWHPWTVFVSISTASWNSKPNLVRTRIMLCVEKD